MRPLSNNPRRNATRASNEYVSRFEKDRTKQTPDGELGKAIRAEYGVPSEVFREFADATATLAEKQMLGVLVLKQSELLQGLREIDLIADMDFLPLIQRLTLPSRDSWRDIPDGYSARDFDLSKFDRRLSLVARPLVALSKDDDPILAVAPALVERAFAHNIGGAIHGTLQGQFWHSQEMIAFAGAAGAQVGLEFNELVASRLSALGLKASPSVKPWACLNQKKTDEVERLGDIDVLACSVDGTIVWVCEAKDLKLCRTLGEAALRLSDYRGQIRSNKPDKLLRHMRRVEYLRAHAALLGKRLRLAGTPAVHGIIIVNAPQPMEQLAYQYVHDSAVVMLDEVENVPWDTGW
jgi:hypothetical protein